MVTMPGTLAEKFSFTVRNEEVAKLINESMGHRVVLSYKQHMGVPTGCFGETGYYVSDVLKVVEDGTPAKVFPVECGGWLSWLVDVMERTTELTTTELGGGAVDV